MTAKPSIVINGDLGSGKTTVSVELAHRLGIKRICVGDLYREMAQRRGMTALQLNLHAELDDEVDGYVDRLQSEIANSGEQLVVDSRLAWHFFSNAFKVHLITETNEAAKRVTGRPSSTVESYTSLNEAIAGLRERSESERMRFITRYGVDKSRLRNYSLICDTTSAAPEEVIECIARSYGEFVSGKLDDVGLPLLFVDPKRVYPTEDIRCLRGSWEPGFSNAGADAISPIDLGYTGEHLFVVDGHKRLSAALQAGHNVIAARLAAEADELVVGGLTARRYFQAEVSLTKVYDWEEAHGTAIPMPVHAMPS